MLSRSPSPSSYPLSISQMEKDIRSDMEESDSSEGEEAQEHPKLKNGAAQVPEVASTDGPRSRAAGRLANGHMLAT